MSLWRRLRQRLGRAPAKVESAARAQPPSTTPPSLKPEPAPRREAERTALEALAAGAAASEAACLSELTAASGSGREKTALAAVLEARARGPVSEPLLTRAAELHLARGEPLAALRLLEGASSVAGLLLQADACAESGAQARALTLVERVLVQDIDAPGARERHERLRRALGGRTPAVHVALSETTLLRSEAPDTTLRIVAEAGRGGAGTVFEAIDDVLSRRVALKIYHQPERERDKLVREARTAVELAGAGVVRVFDIDRDRGHIVMEWLGNGSLKRHLAAKNIAVLFPIQRWLVPLIAVLERVHAAGLVHADIKPANVMLRGTGEPVLLDFGLARPASEVVVGGSVGYMSPERVRGQTRGFAEDLYALGRLVEDALATGGQSESMRRVADLLLGDKAAAVPSATALRELVAGL